jgi:hypothetical protein
MDHQADVQNPVEPQQRLQLKTVNPYRTNMRLAELPLQSLRLSHDSEVLMRTFEFASHDARYRCRPGNRARVRLSAEEFTSKADSLSSIRP